MTLRKLEVLANLAAVVVICLVVLGAVFLSGCDRPIPIPSCPPFCIPSPPPPTPAPTPSPSPSPTPSPTPSPDPEPTPSPSPEPTAAPTPSPEPEPTPGPVPTPTSTPVPTPKPCSAPPTVASNGPAVRIFPYPSGCPKGFVSVGQIAGQPACVAKSSCAGGATAQGEKNDLRCNLNDPRGVTFWEGILDDERRLDFCMIWQPRGWEEVDARAGLVCDAGRGCFDAYGRRYLDTSPGAAATNSWWWLGNCPPLACDPEPAPSPTPTPPPVPTPPPPAQSCPAFSKVTGGLHSCFDAAFQVIPNCRQQEFVPAGGGFTVDTTQRFGGRQPCDPDHPCNGRTDCADLRGQRWEWSGPGGKVTVENSPAGDPERGFFLSVRKAVRGTYRWRACVPDDGRDGLGVPWKYEAGAERCAEGTVEVR